MIGLGEPRIVRAGVVNGSYLDVMGLRPVLGRLINEGDDGPDAAMVVVLTHRFWTTSLNSDPTVLGKTIRLGSRDVVVVGVLEPSVPYPAKTELIANVATSPHHLEATMAKGRTHRMTELFGRLAPGATLEGVRAELTAVHAAMMREHPDAYSPKADVRPTVTPLRDQITAPARRILFALLAAAAVVFVIACSNVANLILARSVRREGELAVRAALGASRGALRRTLLAESLVLCGAGAALGIALAQPLVAVVAQYASRFSVRALDVTVDASLLWVGGSLAIASAVLLAYIPRLPVHAELGSAGGSVRATPATNRRLRIFATTQIAFSFVMLAAAGTLVAALVAMQRASTGMNMRQVLAFDLPTSSIGIRNTQEMDFYDEMTRRIDQVPGVEGVALGSFVPWRDAGFLPRFQFAVEDEHSRTASPTPTRACASSRHTSSPCSASGDRRPRLHERRPRRQRAGCDRQRDARGASVSERRGGGPQAVVDRPALWPATTPPHRRRRRRRRRRERRARAGDDHLPPGSALRAAGRLFVQADGDPYAVVPAVRKSCTTCRRINRWSAATLEDVRSAVRARALRTHSWWPGRRRRIAHRRDWRGGCAGVLRERADARVRRAAGRGIVAAPSARPRAARRRRHRRDRNRRGCRGRLRVRGGRGEVFRQCAAARRPSAPWRRRHSPRRSDRASLMPAARASRVDVLQALRSE